MVFLFLILIRKVGRISFCFGSPYTQAYRVFVVNKFTGVRFPAGRWGVRVVAGLGSRGARTQTDTSDPKTILSRLSQTNTERRKFPGPQESADDDRVAEVAAGIVEAKGVGQDPSLESQVVTGSKAEAPLRLPQTSHFMC